GSCPNATSSSSTTTWPSSSSPTATRRWRWRSSSGRRCVPSSRQRRARHSPRGQGPYGHQPPSSSVHRGLPNGEWSRSPSRASPYLLTSIASDEPDSLERQERDVRRPPPSSNNPD